MQEHYDAIHMRMPLKIPEDFLNLYKFFSISANPRQVIERLMKVETQPYKKLRYFAAFVWLPILTVQLL